MSLASNSELNLLSRWGETWNILPFYCFQLSICQKAMQIITHQHLQCYNPNMECVKFFCRENMCLFCNCPPVTDDDTINYSVIGRNDFGHCDGAKHQHVRSIFSTAAASFKKISLTGWWSWAKLNQVRGRLRKKKGQILNRPNPSLSFVGLIKQRCWLMWSWRSSLNFILSNFSSKVFAAEPRGQKLLSAAGWG